MAATAAELPITTARLVLRRLAATDAPLLVVLGVDMPMVPGELLRRMASAATAGCGVAVRREADIPR